jgi:hypothetical protein
VENDREFREIWAVDTEFYHEDGEKPIPICVVARELITGRLIRLWQDELGPYPPYPLDNDTLILAYAINAEFGVHHALGWGWPANVIDLYVEYRCLINGVPTLAALGSKLTRALEHYKVEGISALYKEEMIERIIASKGRYFSAQDRPDFLDYCQDDVDALARLWPRMCLDIRDLRHALHRGRYMWPVAQMECRGIPVDVPKLESTRLHWEDIRLAIIARMDDGYDVYEGDHFRMEQFEALLEREQIDCWPRSAEGVSIVEKDTFRTMARLFPRLENLRELRSTLRELNLNKLTVGSDGRARAPLFPFWAKTSRNQPSSTAYVFGPSKWTRSFIRPTPGCALVYDDYSQQEIHIAAKLSNDPELLKACVTGDVYLAMAKRFGFAPADATPETHDKERDLFKTVTLAILYGMTARSLAARTKLSLTEARELLTRLRLTYRRFWEFAEEVANIAGYYLEIETGGGWHFHTSTKTNARTIRNWPMQSAGAECLRAACILAESRGIKIIAPVHDALMAEGPAEHAEDLARALGQAMSDASWAVLDGYEIKTKSQIIHATGCFFDKRGLKMWTTVSDLVEQLERKHA